MKYVIGDRVYINTKNTLGPRKYVTGTVFELYTNDLNIDMAGIELDSPLPMSSIIYVSVTMLRRISNVCNN